MKKQIKKLVKKTYLYDNYETVADRQQKIYSFTEEGLEKLAELIVQECCQIVLECSIPGSNNERDFVVTAREIKQHFGVEDE